MLAEDENDRPDFTALKALIGEMKSEDEQTAIIV